MKTMCCKDKSHHNGCSIDMGRGCMFCNCETDPTVKVCEGCFKLHETDWLEGLSETAENDIFEVRFKNTRRSYYKNVNGLELHRGDVVAVESSPGHDIGIISLTGDMVARQMKRVGFNPLNGEFKKIYRKAKPYDIEKWQEAIAMEHETMIRARQLASDMGLNMKIGDVEYQGDKIKAIFYYIADERVDFRELIKVFAEQFRIRVEMKQIGARQEAGRIGGLGSCGRELCCASWISSFVSVTTNSARAQEISLNPQKLAGQCSKLKCCLVYELDDYLDARREFPRINQPLQALDGDYFLVKTDILGRTMSFSTSPNAMIGVVTLPLARIKEILAINKTGRKVDKLEDESMRPVKEADPGFVNMIGEDSITRFDPSREPRQRSKRSGRRGGERRPEGTAAPRENMRREGRPDENRTKPDGGESNRPPRPGERPAQKNESDRPGNIKSGDSNSERPNNNRYRGNKPQGAGNQGRSLNNGDRSGRNPNSDRPGAPNPKPEGASRTRPEGGANRPERAHSNRSEGTHSGRPEGVSNSGNRPSGNRNPGRNRPRNRPNPKPSGE